MRNFKKKNSWYISIFVTITENDEHAKFGNLELSPMIFNVPAFGKIVRLGHCNIRART